MSRDTTDVGSFCAVTQTPEMLQLPCCSAQRRVSMERCDL